MSQFNEADNHSSSMQDISMQDISMQDRFSELDKLNPTDILISNEILDNIKIYDSTM